MRKGLLAIALLGAMAVLSLPCDAQPLTSFKCFSGPPAQAAPQLHSFKCFAAAAAKSVVTVFVGPDCVHCIGIKQEWEGLTAEQRAALPFVLEFQDKRPAWVKVIPTFYWRDQHDKEWKHERRAPLTDFKAIYSGTMRKKGTSPRIGHFSGNGLAELGS